MSSTSASTGAIAWQDAIELMEPALDAAKQAAQMGEVPVGAALYDAQGNLVASAGNRTITDSDPTAHAEVLCLREAARAIGNHRLTGCAMYVTLEPCAMCAGAVMHARLACLCYGAPDPKTGACGSVADLFGLSRLNHQTSVWGGLRQKECGLLLSEFFRERR